ncbi:MAG: Asparagine synthase (glutamine-hydrolyzing) [Candidatus Magnetoglobus multicellularis str. Araruama]|uniref:asparagine synthase (glutamine-hydrolyzing) n=1 Tax=Candidatus Magnetoglobus multicellularis str. Araruama TaxID=890399 RepID=A0A1V1PFM2_9BACT|nr:MAG: Asparagine synthase (glutamine-hydrolyzing) [Candidatus Magnetoglobus multicellularis str. Araruama]
MCGIIGVYDTNNNQNIDQTLLSNMANTLFHRGPDDSGFYIKDNLGLGFMRLSIIDLTTGNQPMFNEDKSLISICNGEVFNYQDIKKDLKSKGHQFYTDCDAEVLVHLYEEHGIDFISKLNGQFAFAIFDKSQKKLILARDHAGIAPLFYTMNKGVFIFGSEIKAILKHPLVKPAVDLTGLDQIFSFPGLVSPTTMFKNIYSLKPGHCIIVKNGELIVKEYWDLNYPEVSDIEYNQSENDYIEKLEELLLQSVKYRLIADVPVGFYLSGGLDSSMIAGLIHRTNPNEKRHSFSIGFNEAELDETRHQQLMSSHVNSIHHEIIFEWYDISERFKNMIFHIECPVKESYNTCSLALSESVKKNNIKVILTGEGADELFAGYVGYRFDEALRAGNDWDDISRIYEEEENQKLWGDRNFFYEIRQYELKDIKHAIYSQHVRSLFQDFDCTNENLVDKSKLNHRHSIHKRSYLDFKLRLADHLLSDHGDRLAYANSIEARYPFLDINVLEFAKEIPPNLKLNGLTEKYILKRIAEKYLPESIINREKFGFVAPGSPYLIGRSEEWINDTLSYNTIKRQGYFDPDTIERLKKIYMSENFSLNLPFENDLLMIVLSFGVFLDLFDMPDY